MPTFHAPALVVAEVREHRLGWLVFCQAERFVRRGSASDMLLGQGCFLVDRLDGSLHELPGPVSFNDAWWVGRYLEDVRGAEPVEEADPLMARVAGLLEQGRRLEAIRTVRAEMPGLDPAGAKRYVDAVADGVPLTEELAAHIPRAERPSPRHVTLTGPNPEPDP